MFIPDISCFYIHIPKTAGTTVVNILFDYLNKEYAVKDILLRHNNLTQCQKYCDQNNIDYPKVIFTTIRNRYSQIQSTYRWLVSRTKDHKTYSKEEYSFEDYLKNVELIISKNETEQFQKKNHFYYDRAGFLIADHRHIAFLDYWTNNNPNVIYLFTESLLDDFNKKVAPLLNIASRNKLNLFNFNEHHKRFNFKASEICLIQRIYGDEIEKFNFKIPKNI